MLFQAVVKFLPILNFFKFHVKGERSIAHIDTCILAKHPVQSRVIFGKLRYDPLPGQPSAKAVHFKPAGHFITTCTRAQHLPGQISGR